ncbi:MAG: uncharacterized protein JWO86_8273 [Myxococcaceae bacterium]|nr:uncharacterized protein [Myxococcaceae bacterium]
MSTDPPLASRATSGTEPVTRTEPEAEAVCRTQPWDASLASRSPLFWPIAGALGLVVDAMARVDATGADAGFPQPETIDAALRARAGIQFERQRPVSRRRRTPRDPSSMYDARIAREGCVPTRPGSWHDLMNALVWATFPLAKRALHERQHGLVVPAAPGESARRPRELDALALLDEGGLLVMSASPLAPEDAAITERERALEEAIASGAATAFVFGHAIYEGLVLGRPAPLASVVCAAGTGTIEDADRALAAVVADRARILDPTAMLRLRADERLMRRPPA